MTKIYMKDIRNICSCISGLSCKNKLNEFERLIND